jgi:hypothetical protein
VKPPLRKLGPCRGSPWWAGAAEAPTGSSARLPIPSGDHSSANVRIPSEVGPSREGVAVASRTLAPALAGDVVAATAHEAEDQAERAVPRGAEHTFFGRCHTRHDRTADSNLETAARAVDLLSHAADVNSTQLLRGHVGCLNAMLCVARSRFGESVAGTWAESHEQEATGATLFKPPYAGATIAAQILASILASRDLGEATALLPLSSHARENPDRSDHATRRLAI